ncbi:TEA domain-containing protein [Mycena kentingensis (nom. inval.)]|nr:TEA domain-containing protein [Mycena kentingensis (nom. inval.)]
MNPPQPIADTQAIFKSITPLRKHRKLLRDGSGGAVWPENVEEIFLQGLREYWESPWATYSGRGRSRYRNQYLVDYLASQNIQRTKKQVASHIQVLRNMLKGEPEYNLVAGADELFQDSVKVEDHQLLTIDDDVSSASNSPPDQLHEFPPSPGESTSPAFPGLSYSPTSPPLLYPRHRRLPTSKTSTPLRFPNRAVTFTLLAEGMTPFIVNLDKLVAPAALPSRTHPLTLRLRLSVPAADDPRAPQTMHGFFASVRLAAIWSEHAKVFTRVYDPAGQCAPQAEAGPLHASNIDLGTVLAELPESTLTRAHWCDPTTQTTITQQVVVDDAVLLFVVYDLDRRAHSMPSVEFVSFQKYAGSSEARASAAPAPVQHQQQQQQPQTAQMYYYTSYIPPTTSSSLSAALNPI